MFRRFVPIVVAMMLAGIVSCSGYGDDGEYSTPTGPQGSDSTSAGSPPGDAPGYP